MSPTATADRPCAPLPGGLLLRVVAIALILAGLCAVVLGLSGRFLPHDEQFLGMTAKELCALHGCRIVHFMYHDRASFGGALVAVGLLYLWLSHFPLRRGDAWAWGALLLSGGGGGPPIPPVPWRGLPP